DRSAHPGYKSPRHPADRAAARARTALPPARAQAPAAPSARSADRRTARRRAGDALPQRIALARRRLSGAADPVSAPADLTGDARTAGARRRAGGLRDP